MLKVLLQSNSPTGKDVVFLKNMSSNLGRVKARQNMKASPWLPFPNCRSKGEIAAAGMPYRDPARVQVTFCAPHGAVDDAAKAQPLPFRHRRVPASSLQSSDGRFDFAQGRSRIALQGILILNIFNMLTPDLVMTLADSERSQQSEDCSCRKPFRESGWSSGSPSYPKCLLSSGLLAAGILSRGHPEGSEGRCSEARGSVASCAAA